jgi:hypothetical protein
VLTTERGDHVELALATRDQQGTAEAALDFAGCYTRGRIAAAAGILTLSGLLGAAVAVPAPQHEVKNAMIHEGTPGPWHEAPLAMDHEGTPNPYEG